MKHKITLPQGNDLTGIYLSIPFVNGIGETDNDFIADKAKLKGFEVESEDAETVDVFVCPHCEKPYKTQEGLNKHIADKHPNGADGDA